ncbi:MAG: hypothetical protein RL699_1783 [Bacteroidota bacterium]|jgi:hypothetical protein
MTTVPTKSTGIPFNWGTGIVLSFVFFMCFILYFVIKVQSNSKYDNELVVEEYYKKDAHFETEMVQLQNAHDLAQQPQISTNAQGILVVFPKQFNPANLKGIVSLYRPSNKKLDFEMPISTSSSTLLIPKKSLVGGLWDITLRWEYEGKTYQSQHNLYYTN